MVSKLKSIAWCVAYRTNNEECFKVVQNPIWGWAADPFLIKRNGKIYIFAELWDYRKGKGGLGYTILEEKNEWHMVIEESYHMSYPHFVSIENELYICPEACNSNSVYFYKCIEFPNKWNKMPPFIDNMDCSDTTFYDVDGELYGVTCLYHEDPIKLLLFRYDNGSVVFSPKNPIYVGGNLARPGGALIKKNNKMIRVSQDCSEYYGKSLVFSEMELKWPTLKETIVKEVNVCDFKFDKNLKPIGIHTYNSLDNIEVVDLKLKVFNIFNILYRIKKKMMKKLS